MNKKKIFNKCSQFLRGMGRTTVCLAAVSTFGLHMHMEFVETDLNDQKQRVEKQLAADKSALLLAQGAERRSLLIAQYDNEIIGRNEISTLEAKYDRARDLGRCGLAGAAAGFLLMASGAAFGAAARRRSQPKVVFTKRKVARTTP